MRAVYVDRLWCVMAQAVFLLEHGYTNTYTYKVTDATDHPTPRLLSV